MTENVRRLLLGLGALSLAAAGAVDATGGLTVRLAGVLLRAHRPLGLIAAGVLCLGWAFVAGGRRAVAADLAAAWDARDRAASWVAATASAVTLAVGLACGTWAASGADASGYVSQAAMWARGDWHIEQPIALQVPWPDADRTFSPLGYRPATTAGAIVPTYPPGLPLTMAPLMAAAGPQGAFFVVPILGAAAVWLAYRAGRRIGGAAGGALAAVALAASPAFLYQLVQPMSDVPVTAWWLAALVFVLERKPGLAGVCTGAAVLTRPNLAPLAGLLAIGVAAADIRSSARRAALATLRFGAGLVPAGVVLLATNAAWYGDPFLSGYGRLDELFAWVNVGPNLRNYTTWLLETQTPFLLLGLALPVLAARRRREAGSEADTSSAGPATLGVLFVLAVACCYLPYAVFEEWWYLRFLLPAIAIGLVLAAATTVIAAERLPRPARIPALVLIGIALTTAYVKGAARGRAFDLRRLEARYVEASRLVSRTLPPQAVLLAAQESGSLRYYTDRPVLRWDQLDPAWLDRALAHLAAQGRPPYLVLEAWEEPDFRARFSAASETGRLDWPPAAEVGQAVRVRVYDPRDRARFLSGQPIRHLRPPTAR